VKLAIKVDVDGLRAARVGALRLADILETLAVGATFLFSVGPDRSGRYPRRLFQRGMPGRLWRTLAIRNQGLGAALYGTVLPAPDLAERAAAAMRTVRERGFDIGVRAFDHAAWRVKAARASAQWTGQQMTLARSRYESALGEAPLSHAAPGWQMNRDAYRMTQRLGYAYSSDTRGTHPFIPVYQAEVISCPQVPTTLPTMDELIAARDADRNNVVARLLELTRDGGARGHVYSANAAFEGLKLQTEFEQLLREWRKQGYEIMSLADYMSSLDGGELPYHEVVSGTVPGRPGTVALQGKPFLGAPSQGASGKTKNHDNTMGA
jgi:undecaprenyl phosphate-alpha-L-ara4FN deformylase